MSDTKTDNKESDQHVENAYPEKDDGSYSPAVASARAGVEAEHQMTLREGIRLYPKAIGWSLLLSTAIIMEGYDTTLLGNFYAFPEFKKKFGDLQPDGTYLITASWQAGLSNASSVGSIFGLMLNGWLSEKVGYRKTILMALVLMIGLLFIPFFAQNTTTLLVGQLLQGVPWGIFQTLTTAYASEIVPVALRAYLTTYVNLCWVIGQFIAAGVLKGMLQRQDEWGYRIPFALQWMWPVPILIGCWFAPESPWWLVRHGRIAEARQTLVRLTSPGNTDFDPDATIAMIVHTNELEKTLNEGTSYLDLFKGIDRRRTEIAAGVWAIQNLCGSAFMGYSTYFLTQAGMATENAFTISLCQYAIGAIGTISSWFLMTRIGRRSLYLYGLVVMVGILLVIGCLGLAPSSKITEVSWGVGGMLLFYVFVYDISVGPVCYCLVAEISSTRLRAKTVVFARACYNIIAIINGVITPYMLNPEAWNWGAKTGFFWFGICLCCVAWTFFRLPEPKGRTFGELDVLFEQRISARKFASTKVDQFTDGGEASEHANAAVHVERI